MDKRKCKVVRLYPEQLKEKADIPSLPPGEPISEETASRILASQLEKVAGAPSFQGGALFLVIMAALVLAVVYSVASN